MSGLAPWQIALYVLDGVLGAASIFGIVVATYSFVSVRKKTGQTDAAE